MNIKKNKDKITTEYILNKKRKAPLSQKTKSQPISHLIKPPREK